MKITKILLSGILLFAGITTSTAQKKYSKNQVKKFKMLVNQAIEHDATDKVKRQKYKW